MATTTTDKPATKCMLCDGKKTRHPRAWVKDKEGNESYALDTTREIDCTNCDGTGFEPPKKLVHLLEEVLASARHAQGLLDDYNKDLTTSEHAANSHVAAAVTMLAESRSALSRLRKMLAGAVEELR